MILLTWNVQKKQIYRNRKISGCLARGEGSGGKLGGLRGTDTNGQVLCFFPGRWWKCWKIDWGEWWLHNSVNIPKTTELQILNRKIVWYMNISIKLHLKNYSLNYRRDDRWSPRSREFSVQPPHCPFFQHGYSAAELDHGNTSWFQFWFQCRPDTWRPLCITLSFHIKRGWFYVAKPML